MENSIIRLLPYQRKWLEDKSRFKAGMMARQCGKTFSATLEIVDSTIEAMANGIKEDWIILSRGERQAQEALNEGIKKHLKAFKISFEMLNLKWKSETKESYNATEVILPNGAKITALPANPDTARGFSRNVLLDEFAFHHDSARIWAAVFPVVTRGNKKIRVISTPNGKDNKFYDIITDKTGVWSTHSTDIYQAVTQGLNLNPDDLKAALGDDVSWAREYELSWVDDATAWLPYALIKEAQYETAGRPELYGGGPCYIGNDIGRKHDLWAAVVVERVADLLIVREVVTKHNETFAEHDRELDRLMEFYNVRRLCMDETGMGAKPVEDAISRYGANLVEGITFTPANKSVMATAAKQLFEDRKIRIPLDAELAKDLGKLRRSFTATGGVRFDAESNASGHADRAWGLNLAVMAAQEAPASFEFSATGDIRISESAFGNANYTPRRGFGVVAGNNNLNGF